MAREAAADLPGLNSLVSNTAYLRAQQVDGRELRRQRLALALPRARRTSWTGSSSAVRPSAETDFQSLCEQQPVGRKLFRQFLLASGPQYAAAAEFLDELSQWDFRDGDKDGGRDEAKLSILKKLMQPKSHSFVSFLKGDGAAKYRGLSENHWEEETVEQLQEATRDFLKGKPFAEYLESPYFYKFLQWKEYEKQKITKKYFYEFRTLGKGGFGEVCGRSDGTLGFWVVGPLGVKDLVCPPGVCGAGEAHWPDVRLQEAGQGAAEEERWREAGPGREADPGEG